MSIATTIKGRGGDLFVEQLQRSGVRFVFSNPSSGSGPIFDALIDRPQMQVILAVHERALSAIADGYAKASGKAPFVIMARPGFPNTLSVQQSAFRDGMPILFCTDTSSESGRGSFGVQEVDDLLECAEPFTRWRWESRRADQLAVDLRRAFKFATTPPSGPVFLAVPQDLWAEDTQGEVYDQHLFDLSPRLRAGTAHVAEIARALIDCQNPLLHVGSEVHRYGAEAAVIELAELLSIPVIQDSASWCNAFPTDHPLYVGRGGSDRSLARIDLVLDLGSSPGAARRATSADVVRDCRFAHVKMDLDSLARASPAQWLITANVGLFAEDLLEAVNAAAGAERIAKLRESRRKLAGASRQRAQEALALALKERRNDDPMSTERLGAELQEHLHRGACIVHEADSSRVALDYLSFGPDGKQFYTTSDLHMGWALGAAMGVKLAQPDRQVVALAGDGGFMFGGSQALWTAQRYEIPVIVLVVNNRSYDAERARIWSGRSRQGELRKDMACYLGKPDIEFTKLAAAYGVAAEKVVEPDELAPALMRATSATQAGRPYLVEIAVARRGPGAQSTWYPRYSLVDRMQRGS